MAWPRPSLVSNPSGRRNHSGRAWFASSFLYPVRNYCKADIVKQALKISRCGRTCLHAVPSAQNRSAPPHFRFYRVEGKGGAPLLCILSDPRGLPGSAGKDAIDSFSRWLRSRGLRRCACPVPFRRPPRSRRCGSNARIRRLQKPRLCQSDRMPQ